MIRFIPICFLVFFVQTRGQLIEKKDIDHWADEYVLDGIKQLKDFLAVPNFGGEPANIDKNLSWCKRAFKALQFETSTLTSRGVKHLLAERKVKDGLPTILFYLQIDGQPIDSSAWNQVSPYIPVLKECTEQSCREVGWEKLENDWNPDWKIFARSASDSKGPAVAFMQSLKILQHKKIEPSFNLKVIMDFQEELGSPTLPPLVRAERGRFSSDALVIMDGVRPHGNMPTLTFGARGIATVQLTVFGAKRDLHSGQFGNFAPNPVFKLSELLSTMKDENGKVLIEGFYNGIKLSKAQNFSDSSSAVNQGALTEAIGIAEPEGIAGSYEEALQYPSFNVRGLQAGWVGAKVRTLIPSQAVAEIDMRLVPGTPGERQIELLRKHIEAEGFQILDSMPTDEQRRRYPKLIQMKSRVGSKAFRTPLDSPMGKWLSLALNRCIGEGKYSKMPSTGGSQPIAPFISTLGIPAVSVRIPNPDSNIHAPNENIRLGNFQQGLQMCLGILTQPYE